MASLPFSKTYKANGFIFVSGQIGVKPGTTELIGDDILEQTHQAMKNIKSALEDAGSGLSEIVKATIYAVDLSNYTQISDIYISYLSEPYPAREFIGVKELPLGAKIEISVIVKT